jgi:hypothetical protein
LRNSLSWSDNKRVFMTLHSLRSRINDIFKYFVARFTTCPASAREQADRTDEEKVPADEDMSSRGRNRDCSRSGAKKADKTWRMRE